GRAVRPWEEDKPQKRVDLPAELRRWARLQAQDLPRPVIILAGWCDPDVEPRMSAYRDSLRKAFEGFRGTLISGGTRSGVSGLAGDIARSSSEIRALSYLPRSLPEGVEKDERYHSPRTIGKAFGPLQPLLSWIDLLGA